MIPLKDENPYSTIPIVNIILIVTNCFFFIYLNYFVPDATQSIIFQLGFIPYELSYLVDIDPKNLVPVPLTIFTAMFMHGGWLHLLSNMLYLWIFGDNVEDVLGHLKYLFFYIMCGIAATLAHGFLNIDSHACKILKLIEIPTRPSRLSSRPACLALQSIGGRWRAGLRQRQKSIDSNCISA